MKLPAMLADLPKGCNIGIKTSASGFTQSWRGYKLHWDVADAERTQPWSDSDQLDPDVGIAA